MADCGVLISSVSLSGLTTEVTFFPQTGGTAVDLGNQVFPFSYVANYYYGTYNCYVPLYAYSYDISILGPTPTPTVTPTETSPTPTPTETTTVTPTNTPTNTETPTNTPSETPTNTPSSTETPTVTPTNTLTPTNTETPTNTPNQTQTPTVTSTPTVTPSGVILYVFDCFTGGTNPYDACNGSESTFIYGVEQIFDENNYFFNTSNGGIVGDISGYYNYLGDLVELDASGNTVGYITLCSLLPTSTPTPTQTQTPTNTPTNTETPTQTQTPTNTETPTPTNTSTQTPTNTQTSTNTQTPTNTPTNTPTQTQTPSGPLCKRYAFYGGTTDTLFVGKDCSGFDYSFTVLGGDTDVTCVGTYIIVSGDGFVTYINPC
jgi:hypothetical protein